MGFGTQMLRIRRFGEMPCGYDAALLNFRFFCAATPQRHFAKVVRGSEVMQGDVFGERRMNVASVV